MVLLGIRDAQISSDLKTTWEINKIGGKPDWLTDAVLLPCQQCQQNQQLLVIQLYCPLTASAYHRNLYVFACSNATCRSTADGWRVVRCQKLDSAFKQQTTNKCSPVELDDWGASKPGVDEWGTDADDWGDSATDTNLLNMITDKISYADIAKSRTDSAVVGDDVQRSADVEADANQMSDMEMTMNQMKTMNVVDVDGDVETSTPGCLIPEEMTIEDSLLPDILLGNSKDVSTEATFGAGQLLSYFINVVDESVDMQLNYKHEEKLLKEYSAREGVNVQAMEEQCTGGSGSKERYEKTVAAHGDKTFQKFMKRISSCPQQLLRYEHQGEALHITPSSKQHIPQCNSCGSARTFELQLMPALVSSLRLDENADSLIEFGTILIYSCSQSCWQDDQGCTYRTEHLLIEDDPDHHLFNLKK